MSTKTAKLKPPASAIGTPAAKNGTSSNGALPKDAKRKKSINELWIEKYGVDDSEAAKSLSRAWNRSYENRKKRID